MKKNLFKIRKGAFKPKTLTCSKCNIKMKKSECEIDIDDIIKDVFMKLRCFECPKCKKRYLGLDEAMKIEKLTVTK